MNEREKIGLQLLSTGIAGLDEVLGGGIPEYSFNLVAGAPGSGKTTLVHQIVFANASTNRPAIYFSVIGEPPLKMLRYQQQMAFFDPDKVGTVIRFVDLSQEVLAGDLERLFDTIIAHIKDANPAIVVFDSFRTVLRPASILGREELELQGFLHKLALHLASWQATSFLVGEYGEQDMQNNPVFTVADGLLWLSQSRERNSIVRKLEVTKLRGMGPIPGLHTFRISARGIEVFPRTIAPLGPVHPRSNARAAFGVPVLDELLDGGLPAGDATIVVGPSGSGKSILSTHFIDAGLRCGEPSVLAVFEDHPDAYLARAKDMGFDFAAAVQGGQLQVLSLLPLDLSADEVLHQIQRAVTQSGAKRLVIDSLNGLELALAPTFRDDIRESIYRMVNRLTRGGVSILITIEVTQSFDRIEFSPHAVSFLAQNIIFQRYVEISGRLRKVITVVKMRRSQHSNEMYEYEVTSQGLKMLGPLTAFSGGVLTGIPSRHSRSEHPPGLTELEAAVLDELLAVNEATEPVLGEQMGIASAALSRALGRLVELNYVIGVVEHGQTLYRPSERPLAART